MPAKNKNNTKRRYYKLLIETQKLINICLKADVLKGTKIERASQQVNNYTDLSGSEQYSLVFEIPHAESQYYHGEILSSIPSSF